MASRRVAERPRVGNDWGCLLRQGEKKKELITETPMRRERERERERERRRNKKEE